MVNQIEIESYLERIKISVRHERIAINLSQKEFSEFINVKFSTYRTFEQDGKISIANFLLILKGLNKLEEFERFLDGFEFKSGIDNPRVEKKEQKDIESLKPIVKASQKQIVLDKSIFGNELFYSVDNGHVYEVSNFITILLQNFNDQRIMLLLKYFGEKRLKPYILKEKNIKLLKMFNKHVAYMKKVK
jgi:transcriptional regulator with XRE-family HTH domain